MAAVSVGAQQHGMVCLDSAGAPVRDALLWNDTRSSDAADALVAELGAGEWAKRIGVVPVAAITVAKLRWLADHEPAHAADVADARDAAVEVDICLDRRIRLREFVLGRPLGRVRQRLDDVVGAAQHRLLRVAPRHSLDDGRYAGLLRPALPLVADDALQRAVIRGEEVRRVIEVGDDGDAIGRRESRNGRARGDAKGERAWHVAIPALIAASSFIAASFSQADMIVLLALGLTQVMLWSAIAPLIAFPSFLSGSAAAGGIALIVSIGQLGGFVGATLIGVLKERTGDYAAAMAVIGLMLLVAAAIVLLLGRSMAPRSATARAGT